MRFGKTGEREIVRALSLAFNKRHPRIIKAIGDDASVTLPAPGQVTLATTDVLVEGSHFQRKLTTPRLLGRKALAVSLSDIAAMGGRPAFFLVSLGITVRTPFDFIPELYRGLGEIAERYGARLVGGNITRSKMAFVSTTLLGEMPAGEVIYRKGAKRGDGIYVTGSIGDSALGLSVLNERGPEAIKRGPFGKAVKRHLDPEPRVAFGRALARRALASAMIDISDGLVLDLMRLCEESAVGAEVDFAHIPLSREMINFSRKNRRRAEEFILSGGEDYELLFTARPEKERTLMRMARRLDTPVARIGRVTARRSGVKVFDEEGRIMETPEPGFLHF